MVEDGFLERSEMPDSESSAWPYALHDLVVRADVCNLRCSYCGLAVENVPPMALQDGLVGLRGSDGKLIQMEPVSRVRESAESVARSVRENHAMALKISGGELSAVPQWMDLLFDLAGSLANVQLLSNGLALKPEMVHRITQTKHLVVQISLDGHTAQANQYRQLSQAGVERILGAIRKIAQAGMRVEINVVLHNLNLSIFGAFAGWASAAMRGSTGTIKLLPRPVRGPTAPAMRGDEAQIQAFLEDLKTAPAEVLPPQPYLDRLAELLRSGIRKWPCYVPYFVLGTDERGEIAVCTCGSHLGTAGFVHRSPQVLRDGPTFPPESAMEKCADCMTQYEMFNLYIEGQITAEQCDIYPMQQLSAKQIEHLRCRLIKRMERVDEAWSERDSLFAGSFQEEL